jgi:NTE family protein
MWVFKYAANPDTRAGYPPRRLRNLPYPSGRPGAALADTGAKTPEVPPRPITSMPETAVVLFSGAKQRLLSTIWVRRWKGRAAGASSLRARAAAMRRYNHDMFTALEDRSKEPRVRVGVALGSGSARGWAHIGVLRALSEAGIEPEVVAGTSIGALVGAAYVQGSLEQFESWVRELTPRNVIRYMDLEPFGRGGLATVERLLQSLRPFMDDVDIQALEKPFIAVATDLKTGREVWLDRGPLLAAVRASIALPGLLTPVKRGERWLVDGGLVNPVPVSVCRALGAEVVLGVNLNADVLGRRALARQSRQEESDAESAPLGLGGIADQLGASLRRGTDSLIASLRGSRPDTPHLFEVLAGALNIMQDRITRSRAAGDPPDVMLVPRLAQLGLLEFHRAADAIAEGRRSVERMLPALENALGITL